MKTVGELMAALDELENVKRKIIILEAKRDELEQRINEALGRS